MTRTPQPIVACRDSTARAPSRTGDGFLWGNFFLALHLELKFPNKAETVHWTTMW